MATPQLAKKSKDGLRPGYGGWDILDWIVEKGTKYAPILKTGVAALSTYGAWKDQQKKNEMQEGAYNDYMRQAEAAGHEARAAVDINLTPMTVSNVPTSKADITDFTAVAARGGLMSVPNRQRKRYYAGTDEEEVLDTEEEVLSPFDLQQETGIDLMGEQVKYNTGNPREGAWSVWNSGGINQEIYDFDFEIFFDSGDWTDMLKGQVGVEENMQMASADSVLQDEYDKYVFDIQEQGGTPMSIEQFRDQAVSGMAIGGIAGLRHGGRPGYQDGTPDTAGVVSEVSPSRKTQIEGNQLAEDAYNEIFRKFYERFPGIEEEVSIEDMIAMLQAEGVMETEDLGILGLDRSLDMITPESVAKDTQRISRGDTQYGNIPEELFAHGGRIGYDDGGPADDKLMARVKELQDEGLDFAAAMAQAMKELSSGKAHGGRIGYSEGSWESEWEDIYQNYKLKQIELGQEFVSKEEFIEQYQNNMATGGRPGYAFGPGPVMDQETMAQSITLPDGGEEVVTDSMTEIEGQTAGGGDRGWKAQMLADDWAWERHGKDFADLSQIQQIEIYGEALDFIDSGGNAKGGLPKRVKRAPGGIMDLGGMEKDYRTTGGFVPLGGREKADDVPARLSKNEFVMTADAVRAAGGGSINKGAQRMYDTMKHLEASPQSKRMTA